VRPLGGLLAQVRRAGAGGRGSGGQLGRAVRPVHRPSRAAAQRAAAGRACTAAVSRAGARAALCAVPCRHTQWHFEHSSRRRHALHGMVSARPLVPGTDLCHCCSSGASSLLGGPVGCHSCGPAELAATSECYECCALVGGEPAGARRCWCRATQRRWTSWPSRCGLRTSRRCGHALACQLRGALGDAGQRGAAGTRSCGMESGKYAAHGWGSVVR